MVRFRLCGLGYGGGVVRGWIAGIELVRGSGLARR